MKLQPILCRDCPHRTDSALHSQVDKTKRLEFIHICHNSSPLHSRKCRGSHAWRKTQFDSGKSRESITVSY